MEIPDRLLLGNPAVVRIIKFHIVKSPKYGDNYIDSLSSQHLQNVNEEDEEYQINSYDNILFRHIYSIIKSSLHNTGFQYLISGEINCFNDISFDVNCPIFSLNFQLRLMGLNNIQYKGKYIDDVYYSMISWNSSYVNSGVGNYYILNNEVKTFPVSNNNNIPILFTFIAYYSNRYDDDENLKPTLTKLLAINRLTNIRYDVVFDDTETLMTSIAGFNQISLIIRNFDIIFKRFYFPITHNLMLLLNGVPNIFSNYISDDDLVREFYFIRNKIHNHETIDEEFFIDISDL